MSALGVENQAKPGRRPAVGLVAASAAAPQGEHLGGDRPGRGERGDRGGWQPRGDAGQQQAQQQRPQRSWAPPVAQPQAAPAPAPVQSTRNWSRSDTPPSGGRNWSDADNRRGNAAPGVNWTEAAGRDRQQAGRDRDQDRDGGRDRDRDRNWNGDRRGSGGYDRDYRRDGRDNDHRYDRDNRRADNRWDRQWRGNSRYNWQSYRRGHPETFRLGAYYAPYRGYSYRRLSIGFYLDGLFFGSRYWIADPWQYRLPDVYGPYRWVRYYDDALLVNTYTGEVVDVIYDVFW